MREIKFRGQRVDNKEWVYGHYFETPLTDESTGSKPEDGWCFLAGRKRHCISTENGCVYEVIPSTVGQFTGLHDKNGKEIYEGDIFHLGDTRIRYTVVWNGAGMVGKNEKCYGSYVGLFHLNDEAEVIGDIHEVKHE